MKKKFEIQFILLIFFAAVSCADTKTNSGTPWINLFNGVDLSGFTQISGDAIYEVVDSAIVGTTVWDSPNSFLRTDSTYSDFILELKFKVDDNLNSGVQIRSDIYPNGTVYGYQVEIDPTARAFTGGIYDEARRGWLYPLNDLDRDDANRAYKYGEWNHFRVEAIGGHITTWLNGTAIANLWDNMSSSGFIALQVHAIGDSSMLGKQVMWKDIRIITSNPADYSRVNNAPEKSYFINELTESEKNEGWKLLFDGETTTGWRNAYKGSFPEKGWEIRDGELIVLASSGAESQNGGDIVTIDKYSDFDLKLQVLITEGANSGIKYFVTEKEKNNPGSAIGLEYQILDDEVHPDANLGNHKNSRTFASLYDLIAAENKRVNAPGQWNNVRIVSKNNHVEHWLNGFKVLEYERGSDAFRKLVSESKYKSHRGFGEAESGYILLQDHGNEVHFRSIKINPGK